MALKKYIRLKDINGFNKYERFEKYARLKNINGFEKFASTKYQCVSNICLP